MEHAPENTPPAEQESLPPLSASLEVKSDYFDRHPEAVRPGDLNNLHLWLPGSKYLTMLERAMDKTRKSYGTSGVRHSEAWLDQTLRQFAKAVGDALQELPETDRKAISDEKNPQLLQQFLVPLYLKLREKGYSHYDIVV